MTEDAELDPEDLTLAIIEEAKRRLDADIRSRGYLNEEGRARSWSALTIWAVNLALSGWRPTPEQIAAKRAMATGEIIPEIMNADLGEAPRPASEATLKVVEHWSKKHPDLPPEEIAAAARSVAPAIDALARSGELDALLDGGAQ